MWQVEGWEVGSVGGEGGGWEVAGGKSEDRRRSLEIESINRYRSNRFGHGMSLNRLTHDITQPSAKRFRILPRPRASFKFWNFAQLGFCEPSPKNVSARYVLLLDSLQRRIKTLQVHVELSRRFQVWEYAKLLKECPCSPLTVA